MEMYIIKLEKSFFPENDIKWMPQIACQYLYPSLIIKPLAFIR